MPFSVKNHVWLELGKKKTIDFHQDWYASKERKYMHYFLICKTALMCSSKVTTCMICHLLYLLNEPQVKMQIPNNFPKHVQMAVAEPSTL